MNQYPITTKLKYIQELDSSIKNISQVDCKVWNWVPERGNCASACYQVTST